jgi:uncharacterized membrane protein YdjX (TVP38/TMEM64 family)
LATNIESNGQELEKMFQRISPTSCTFRARYGLIRARSEYAADAKLQITLSGRNARLVMMSEEPTPNTGLAASEQITPHGSPRRGPIRLAAFAVVIGILFAASFFFPVGEWFAGFRDWVEQQGAWGAIWFGVVYVICTVLFVPGSILTLGAGAIYGPVWGTILISIASTTGAACAFLVGRYAARDQVRAWIQKRRELAALDLAVARKGAWIVFLLRLSPIFPFNLLNYALGLTGVRFSTYLLASWIGMIPGTIAYVLIGYAGQQALAGEQKLWYWVVAAGATLIVTVFITRLATRAIREATVDKSEIHNPGSEKGNGTAG